jgi:plastocyanin
MAETRIDITGMSFPANTQVAKGDTVTWTNKTRGRHTVTSNKPGQFDSGQLAPDRSWSHTFNEAGPHPYHCENHPDDMKGTVNVSG